MQEDNKDFVNSLVWGITGVIGFIVLVMLILMIFFGVNL
jgi:uncharacterized membrane protein